MNKTELNDFIKEQFTQEVIDRIVSKHFPKNKARLEKNYHIIEINKDADKNEVKKIITETLITFAKHLGRGSNIFISSCNGGSFVIEKDKEYEVRLMSLGEQNETI